MSLSGSVFLSPRVALLLAFVWFCISAAVYSGLASCLFFPGSDSLCCCFWSRFLLCFSGSSSTTDCCLASCLCPGSTSAAEVWPSFLSLFGSTSAVGPGLASCLWFLPLLALLILTLLLLDWLCCCCWSWSCFLHFLSSVSAAGLEVASCLSLTLFFTGDSGLACCLCLALLTLALGFGYCLCLCYC